MVSRKRVHIGIIGGCAVRECTLIIPFYRNPLMLRRQLEEIAKYPTEWRVIIVDDGSPEPAEPIIDEWRQSNVCVVGVALYRIDVDIPWNREGARNLASRECETEWMLHVDIDHVLPTECAETLVGEMACWEPDSHYFYRFQRSRVGRADETRKKDRIADNAEFGRIHPHIDSYLCTKEAYWAAGGYNEEYFSGILGGGSEFLRRLEKYGARAAIAPDPLELHVYTRTAVADASDLYCSRDMSAVRAAERKLRELGSPKPDRATLCKFPWHRVL